MSLATLELLDQSFSATWQELRARNSPAISKSNEQATRAAIAKSISDLAATGVRDQNRLKRHALYAAGQARPPKRARTIVHLPD
jgi:hypothetical protein